MQVGDVVTWNPAFVEKYGDRFPFDTDVEGEVTVVADNKFGHQICMVFWNEPVSPGFPCEQQHMATDLRKKNLK